MPPKGATKNKIVSNKGGAKSPAKSAMAKKVKSTSAKKIAKLTARKPAKKTAAPAPAPAEIETVSLFPLFPAPKHPPYPLNASCHFLTTRQFSIHLSINRFPQSL